jgi:hypothetical protein
MLRYRDAPPGTGTAIAARAPSRLNVYRDRWRAALS